MKLAEAKEWQKDALVLLSPPRPLTEGVIESPGDLPAISRRSGRRFIRRFILRSIRLFSTWQVIASLEGLVARFETVHVALPELSMLEKRLADANGWRGRAKDALRGTCDVMSMTKILADAVSLGVDLDELSQLKEQLKEQRWVEAAELSLSSTVSLEVPT